MTTSQNGKSKKMKTADNGKGILFTLGLAIGLLALWIAIPIGIVGLGAMGCLIFGGSFQTWTKFFTFILLAAFGYYAATEFMALYPKDADLYAICITIGTIIVMAIALIPDWEAKEKADVVVDTNVKGSEINWQKYEQTPAPRWQDILEESALEDLRRIRREKS